MNDRFVALWLVLWLVLDAVALIALLRLLHAGASARASAIVMAALQLAALGAGAASASVDGVAALALIWATIVMVNLALAVAGLRRGARLLSFIGLAGTVVAVGLGIPVAACSAVILLGAALLPQPSRSSAISGHQWTSLNWREVFAGFLLALALTLVGGFLGFPSVGLFAGTAAGSYIAARRAGQHEAAQGAGVAVLVLVAGAVAFVIVYPFEALNQSTYNDSINSTALVWAAAVIVLGPAIGLAARR